MSKIALSFSTTGTFTDSFYLAASVMLKMADKIGLVYVNSSSNSSGTSYSGLTPEGASAVKSAIDTIFADKDWSSVEAVKHSTNYLGDYFQANATGISATLTGKSGSGYTKISGSALIAPIKGQGVTGDMTAWSTCMGKIIPYINHKIAAMSESDYKAFVAAVIEAGGLSDYEQTNTPVQA